MTGELLTDPLKQLAAWFMGWLNDAVVAIVDAWPIGMPALPSFPAGLGEPFAWVRWSPIPVDAGFAFIVFAVSVWTLWLVTVPILRWAKGAE